MFFRIEKMSKPFPRDIDANGVTFRYDLHGQPANAKPYYPASPSWVATNPSSGTSGPVSTTVVFNALLALGEWDVSPQEGYWTLAGIRLSNPEVEVGEDFRSVCKYVETKPAINTYVTRFTAEQVHAMIAAEVADVETTQSEFTQPTKDQ